MSLTIVNKHDKITKVKLFTRGEDIVRVWSCNLFEACWLRTNRSFQYAFATSHERDL